MILLCIGYVIRIDAGSKIINVESSIIMLNSTFFLALFFISLKRLSEINIFKISKPINNKRLVLNYYKPKTLKVLSISSIFIIDILILIYIYLNQLYLIFVFILGTIFLLRYYLITRNSSLGEMPIDLILKDKYLLTISILSLLITFLIYI